MAGTSLIRVRLALYEALDAARQASELPVGVTVSYSYNRNVGRKALYLGKARAEQEAARAGGAGRYERDEQVLALLHVFVRMPGADHTKTDVEAEAIGLVVEELLAATPSVIHSVTGLYYAGVDSIDLDPATDDDGVVTDLTYALRFRARLT